MTLSQLFPEADYGFAFRFERAEPAGFFRATPENEKLLAQRRFWLESEPLRYAALSAQGVPLLGETLELEFAPREGVAACRARDIPAPWEPCLALGKAWEPDFLLLAIEPAGVVRLVGGCVCFPSSWSLEEKIGHPLGAIHAIVPGLNATLGTRIHAFLVKLRPGLAWLRSNWGLSRSAELNQHPARGLPRLEANARLEEVWLRVEHQALLALPRTRSVLFAIRVAMHPLAEIQANPALAIRLARALATMPEAMARYKGLVEARQRIISLLDTTRGPLSDREAAALARSSSSGSGLCNPVLPDNLEPS